MRVIIKTSDNKVVEVDMTQCYVAVLLTNEEKSATTTKTETDSLVFSFPAQTPEEEEKAFIYGIYSLLPNNE